MIMDSGGLKAALEDWERAGVIGVDTESNSFFAYHERLCLLQVSTDEDDYIVDPIAIGDDLRVINPILADESVVKIFHSAEFDLMLLKKDLGAEVRGLFDTQVAMTLLNHERTGLAALIESTFGMELSKKEQRSNWGRRPLSPQQTAYARIDTHFLPELYRKLLAELQSADRYRAAEGEFRRLEVEVLKPREPDLEGWRRIKGVRQLDPEGAARLRALFHWREELGQELDLPVFRVMSNHAILDLATHPPRDVRSMARVKGIGFRNARRLGDQVLKVLAGVEGQRLEEPKRKRATPAEIRSRRIRQENQDTLRKWRKETALGLGLPSERLLHRRQLEEIGRRLPRSSKELLGVVELNDWQRENLEASLLEVLAGLQDPGADE